MKPPIALFGLVAVFTFSCPAPSQAALLPDPPAPGLNTVARWNQIAIDASGLDHEKDLFEIEQFGPCRASRAIAIVQVAVFECVNAIHGRYPSYLGIPRENSSTNRDAAVAQAARDTLASLFPSQASHFDGYLAEDLSIIRAGKSKTKGIQLGQAVAAKILANRSADGSQGEETFYADYTPEFGIEQWTQDPVFPFPWALGLNWGQVTPFVMKSGDQFRLPPPPPFDSMEHTIAFVQAKRLGAIDSAERTDEEAFIGTFWAYDGTPSLCAPPRLYNQLARTVAAQMQTNETELAHLLAIVNVALADTAIAAWDSKWHYKLARPVTVIRGMTYDATPWNPDDPRVYGDDGNPDTAEVPDFTPLGAPASNLAGVPDFTPPFPSYPSGHAAFGGALFETLRRFYGRDDIAFTFVSDEFNGVTEGRPYRPRSFSSFTEAETENASSRIFLGIHWSYDASSGIEQGRNVADYVLDHLYQ